MRYPVAQPSLGEEERENLNRAISSNWISRGSFVESFERILRTFCHRKYGLACSSGTAALHLALEACGIGPGDQVVVPDYTYVAVRNAVLYCGATPIYCDIREGDWTIDLDLIEMTPKAVIVVHTYGVPVRPYYISGLYDKFPGVVVIEDFAQAMGAYADNARPVGSLGDISCCSFFANKTVTTGEGGAVLTDRRELHDRMSELSMHSSFPSHPYMHTGVGFNYRMSDLHAAVGVAQLKKLRGFLEKKRAISDYYRENLHYSVQDNTADASSHWMNVILAGDAVGLAKHLFDHGIQAKPGFYPFHKMDPLGRKLKPLPVSSDVSRRAVVLPSYVDLSKSDLEFICSKINQFQENDHGNQEEVHQEEVDQEVHQEEVDCEKI